MAKHEEAVQNLTEAFYETYKQLVAKGIDALGIRLSLRTAIKSVLSENDFGGFTREKGARDFVTNMGRDKFIDEMCYRYLNSFQNIDEIPDERVREAYYRSNHANKGHRDTMQLLREELANDSENRTKMVGVIVNSILSSIVLTKEAVPEGMKNVLPNLPNTAKYIVGGEKEKRYVRKELELGEMAAVSDIGRKARTQENAVLLMHHPEKPEFKMMAVADGEGPGAKGEIASEMAIILSERWFNGLSSKYFEDTDKLDTLIVGLTKQISKAIVTRLGKDVAGTNFACVIKGKRDTIIANVGDTRIYVVGEKGVHQLTEDDSKAYQYYKEGKIPKDSIGFLKEEHKESLLLGLDTDTCCDMILRSNEPNYIIATKGVTDLVDLENLDMMTICKETPIDIARIIADKVASTIKLPGAELKNGTGFNIRPLEGGKMDATVAVYSERQRKKVGTRFYDFVNVDNQDGEDLLNEVGEKVDTVKDRIGRGIDKLRRELSKDKDNRGR